uniref:Uncharacterized protein n=1 Tax=Anguilla anguilla TaxID=7936 RepID=A0A0E9V9P2_ANGAN
MGLHSLSFINSLVPNALGRRGMSLDLWSCVPSGSFWCNIFWSTDRHQKLIEILTQSV